MSAPDVIPTLIETERLLIRAVDPQYAVQMHEAVAESIDELRPWMPWAQTLSTLQEQQARMTDAAEIYARGEELQMLLFRRGDNALVGSSGLPRLDWEVPRFEIGYWRRTRFGGQGYVTEAVRAIADFAFRELGALRVEIWASSDNHASQRVAERAGFRREAVLAQHRRDPSGTVADSVVFARTLADNAASC
ncbi:MAG: GNAT family N-acetyltransferase [Planctomycetales bacterium]|nr:GNAT family N-acetyltransferase [Planctomycetales bacterium]